MARSDWASYQPGTDFAIALFIGFEAFGFAMHGLYGRKQLEQTQVKAPIIA